MLKEGVMRCHQKNNFDDQRSSTEPPQYVETAGEDDEDDPLDSYNATFISLDMAVTVCS